MLGQLHPSYARDAAGALSDLPSLPSPVLSYPDSWLIKTSVCAVAEHKKKNKKMKKAMLFLRLGFIAPCCNQTSQILSQEQ